MEQCGYRIWNGTKYDYHLLEKVELSTGIEDHQGQMIYESDIISFTWEGTFEDTEVVGIVVWDKFAKAFFVDVVSNGCGIMLTLANEKMSNLKILGNSNQNPDLKF